MGTHYHDSTYNARTPVAMYVLEMDLALCIVVLYKPVIYRGYISRAKPRQRPSRGKPIALGPNYERRKAVRLNFLLSCHDLVAVSHHFVLQRFISWQSLSVNSQTPQIDGKGAGEGSQYAVRSYTAVVSRSYILAR